MSKKPRWTSDQIKNSGLIETDKGFIKSEKLVDKKPEKISLIEQMSPYVEQLTNAQTKIKMIIKKETSEKSKKLPSLIERAIPLLDEMDKIIIKQQEIKKKGNRRVKNAKKTEAYGIVFDSKLESYMYGLLENARIEFKHQEVIVLQNKFNYNGEAVRAIKCVVDFWLVDHDIIIDTKGFATDVSKLKFKLLKNYFYTWDRTVLRIYEPPKIEMPKNKSECDALLNSILYNK